MVLAAVLVLAAGVACASQENARGVHGTPALMQRQVSSNQLSVDKNLREDSTDAINGAMAQQLGDNIAALSDLAHSTGPNAKANLIVLKEAGKISSRMIHQFGNISQVLDASQQQLLEQVIQIINATIIPAVSAQIVDTQTNLNERANVVTACNTAINGRLGPSGDITVIRTLAETCQETYDDAVSQLADATAAQTAALTALNNYMGSISAAPECADFPAVRNKINLDAFFSSSSYVSWYIAAQSAYNPLSDAVDSAAENIVAREGDRDTADVCRTTEYCDWSLELTRGCNTLDTCYATATADYNSAAEGAAGILSNVNNVYQAGRTIIAHIEFLLGRVPFDANPTFPSPYSLVYRTLPDKAPCDQTPLTDASWNPPIVCTNPTPPLTPAPTPAPTPQAIDLGDITPDGSTSADWAFLGGGTYSFSGTESPSDQTYSLAYLTSRTDSEFTATVNFQGYIAGIFARATPDYTGNGDTYYLCRLDKRPRIGLALIKSRNTVLSGHENTADEENTDIDLKIKVEGSTISCYKNGVLVESATDSEFSAGVIGLATWRASATFSNLRVA